jgi:NAD-dependent dihydropyrimidine dehydrogenase PreA subunit
MAYVIAEPCVAACHAACVSVCPVDCIHGPPSPARVQLFINPEECTSCGACASECPASAIFDEDVLPPEWERYRALNAEYFARR